MGYFEEGETYKNDKFEDLMFVLAIDSEDEIEAWLAILWIDPVTKGQKDADEICIKQEDFENWIKEELV